MKRLPLYAAAAAIEMSEHTPAVIERQLGLSEGSLDQELFEGGVLSAEETRRVRGYLWRLGVGMVDLPGIEGAFRLKPVATVRGWCELAQECPWTRCGGWAFRLFAPAWRTWLRLSGRGYLIAMPPRRWPT
jgi:hypothetical protein